MTMTRKFSGVWIPADLWLDRNLSITEKVMLVEIESLDHADRGCYASNAHFAEFFGLSKSRVSELISGIEQKGLITVELIREGKQVISRSIRRVYPFGKPNTPSENTATPIRKTEDPYSENTKGSNTKSSNTRSSKATGASGEAPGYAQAASSSSSASAETGQSSAATSAATSNNPMSQPSLSGMDEAVGSEAKKTGKAKAAKGPVDVGMFAIPDWLPREKLQDFVNDRSDRKKPMTKRAVQLLINELVKIHGQGHDPVAAIDKAILKGWTSVYAPNDAMTANGQSKFPGTRKFDPREAINQARRQSHEQDADCINGQAIRLD